MKYSSWDQKRGAKPPVAWKVSYNLKDLRLLQFQKHLEIFWKTYTFSVNSKDLRIISRTSVKSIRLPDNPLDCQGGDESPFFSTHSPLVSSGVKRVWGKMGHFVTFQGIILRINEKRNCTKKCYRAT